MVLDTEGIPDIDLKALIRLHRLDITNAAKLWFLVMLFGLCKCEIPLIKLFTDFPEFF